MFDAPSELTKADMTADAMTYDCPATPEKEEKPATQIKPTIVPPKSQSKRIMKFRDLYRKGFFNQK